MSEELGDDDEVILCVLFFGFIALVVGGGFSFGVALIFLSFQQAAGVMLVGSVISCGLMIRYIIKSSRKSKD